MAENSGMKKQHVKLTAEDRAYLETLISQGQQKVRIFRRALGLLELDRGQTYTAVSESLQVTLPTVSNWAAQYAKNGLKAISNQPLPGRPVEIDGNKRARR